MQARPATLGLGLCLLAALGGVAHRWPRDAGWWHQEVWWQSAGEGMGLMVATMVLAAVALTRWLGRGRTGQVAE